MNRSERQSGRYHLPMQKSCGTEDGGPKLKRSVDSSDERSDEEYQADINWLKHTPAVSADTDMVMEKMKNTLCVRRKLVNEQSPAAFVIREFPQFQITPGLVSK